jgi:hypothetical protein
MRCLTIALQGNNRALERADHLIAEGKNDEAAELLKDLALNGCIFDIRKTAAKKLKDLGFEFTPPPEPQDEAESRPAAELDNSIEQWLERSEARMTPEEKEAEEAATKVRYEELEQYEKKRMPKILDLLRGEKGACILPPASKKDIADCYQDLKALALPHPFPEPSGDPLDDLFAFYRLCDGFVYKDLEIFRSNTVWEEKEGGRRIMDIVRVNMDLYKNIPCFRKPSGKCAARFFFALAARTSIFSDTTTRLKSTRPAVSRILRYTRNMKVSPIFLTVKRGRDSLKICTGRYTASTPS